MTSKHTESQLYTERVYIDPQHLLQMKRERKPFKQVPSIFQPPPEEIDDTRYTSTLSNPKPSIPSSSLKQQEIGHQELITKNASPNVEFIVGLMGSIKSDEVILYEEGDCIGIREEDRCLILEGSVKVTGVGGRTFTLGQGNILFIHPQTIEKVRQILCLKASKVLRLPSRIFPTLRNYLFLKNAQKIKYLKYCPFFIWAQTLTQDLASCMTMKVFERGHYIYTRGDPSQQIYFVKQGVVLLERSVLLNSEVMKEYESHYERSQISTSEATLIVKKGMVFGIDGILLKDVSDRPISVERDITNPEQRFERRVKPTTRVYTSKTLGRTQVYILKRQLLEGLFDVADLLSPRNFQKELTKEDLQRICSEYSQMVVRKHRSLPKFSQVVATTPMTFSPSNEGLEELLQKKTKVKMVRQYQKNVKRHSIANIIADTKALKKREDKEKDNHSIILQQHFSQRLGVSDVIQQSGLAFPRLSSSLKKKRLLNKDSKEDNGEKYIISWLKSQDPSKKPKSMQKKTPTQNFARLKLINVRSYRSIVPSLN